MPWHMLFICPKCGARCVSPEMPASDGAMEDVRAAIIGAMLEPTFACHRCNPRDGDDDEGMVESRRLAIYAGEPLDA